MRNSIGRCLIGAALALSAGTATVAATAVAAHAYTPLQTDDCGGTDSSGHEQPKARFTDGSDVRLVVHYGESGLDPVQQLLMLAAVNEVNEQFNQMGGTSAHVTMISYDTLPFVWGKDSKGVYKTYHDGVPTIHVGFVRDLDDNEIGLTVVPVGEAGSCRYNSTSIAFLDNTGLKNTTKDPDTGNPGTVWDFKESRNYYLEGRNGAGTTYFRGVYLHELLHAFGLAHSKTSYSFMNYGDNPWANRPSGEKIRPLPDDVRAMRNIYPASGSRFDVALLNTWFDDTPPLTNDAANGRLFCRPGKGHGMGPTMFGPYDHCGDSTATDPTEVCPGANLQTWFALANYSTYDVSSSVWLYFSTDDTWDASDPASTSFAMVDQTPAQSSHRGFAFKVPNLPGPAGTYYRPILRAIAVPDPYLPARDEWMPLTGTVKLGSCT